jgi:MFS family permease
MEAEFGWDRSTVVLAATIGYAVTGLAQPFMGRLYDRVGGRKMILWSLFVMGVAQILLAFTNHVAFLIILFGVVLSLGMSGGSLNTTVNLITKWFQRNRGIAIAIIAAGGPAGAMVLVPMSSYLIDIVGWRATWAVLGLTVLVLAFPLSYLLIKEQPSDLGVSPDGDDVGMDGTNGKKLPATRAPLERDHWINAFKTFPMWQLSGGYFVCGFTAAFLSVHFVPYAIEEGFSPGLAATAFGLMSGLNVAGVLVVGALGDKFERKILLAAVYGTRGIAYAALLLIPGVSGLWLFVFLAGLSWIATVPPTTGLTADVYGLKHIGTLSGISFTAHQIGGAIAVQLGGVLRDATGSYTVPFVIAAILLGAASILVFLIQERKYALRYQQPVVVPSAHGAG